MLKGELVLQNLVILLTGGTGSLGFAFVSATDGKFGYGGKCFPKDVNAFANLTKGTSMGRLLEPMHELNVHFRGFEEHI